MRINFAVPITGMIHTMVLDSLYGHAIGYLNSNSKRPWPLFRVLVERLRG